MLKGKRRYAGWLGAACLLVASIVCAEDEPQLVFQVDTFNVVGQLPFTQAKVDKILQPFTGSHSGLEGLQAAGDALEAELRDAGYAFFVVSLPPQTLTDGTVSLEVEQQRIGNIRVTGQQFFAEQNIRASIPTLVAGLPPNTREISRSVNLANENPSKEVTVSFAAGVRPGEIDATLKVADQREWNAFTTLSNTGNTLTGKWRNTLGFQHNNLWHKDHSYTAAITYAPGEGSTVSQYSLNYRLPLYTHAGSLTLFLSRSNVDTGVVDLNSAAGGAPQFGSLLGGGQIAGLRYSKALLNLGRYRHSLSLSLEDKLVDNETLIQLLGTPFNDRRRATPLTLGYMASYQHGHNRWTGQLYYAKNMELNNHNEQADYSSAPGTPDVAWDVWRASLYQDIGFAGGWLWRLQLGAQRANEVLIPGEKYGIGGASTVRGYTERVLAGDNAVLVRNELWAKPLSGLRLLFFYDWGEVSNLRASGSNLKETAQLAGHGIGLRYTVGNWLSAQLDIASPNDAVADRSAGDGYAHFSLFARF